MEWGPWIDHDGNGCPCVGEYVHVKYRYIGKNPDGSLSDHRLYIAANSGSWNWVNPGNYIIRYRIRKPLGLTVLETILNELPKPVTQKELTE